MTRHKKVKQTTVHGHHMAGLSSFQGAYMCFLDDDNKGPPMHFKKLSWKILTACKKLKAGTSEKL